MLAALHPIIFSIISAKLCKIYKVAIEPVHAKAPFIPNFAFNSSLKLKREGRDQSFTEGTVIQRRRNQSASSSRNNLTNLAPQVSDVIIKQEKLSWPSQMFPTTNSAMIIIGDSDDSVSLTESVESSQIQSSSDELLL